MIRRVLSVQLILCIFCLLCGCATASQQAGLTDGREEITVINDVYVHDLDLSGRFDSITGVVKTQSGSIVVAGMSDYHPYVSVIDVSGNELTGYIPEHPDNGDASIIGICAHEEDGYILYFPSGIVFYTDRGEVKESIDISDESLTQGETLFGPFHLTEHSVLLWSSDQIYCIDGHKSLSVTGLESGQQICGILRHADHCYILLADGGTTVLRKIYKTTMQSEQEMTTDEIHRLSSTAFSGFENELFLNTSTSVYTFDTTQYIPEKIFDWEQAGFSGGDICHMVSLKNGELLCAMRNNNVLYRIEIIEDTSQRKKITIGAINREGNDLEPYVARFNASQDAYFAEIIYYGPENTSRLKTELIAGTAPDVLLLNETTITVSEASFTDLLPLLNEDETLAGDDLVENIFQLMLMEGKMLFAMDSFWFVTITGRSQTVGDRNTWTTKDFEQLLAAHPESYTFNWWQNRQFLGAHAAMMSIGDCVDFDTMTCDFEKDSFTDLLSFIEIAGALCAPEGAMQDDDERILLQFHGAQNELHANGCALTYGPGNYSYIGFPNDEGTPGGYFEPSPFGLVFAIPQQTANKDAAWQFIRGIYDREWQDREIMPGAPFGSGFAVTKASRDARIEHIQEMEDAHCTEEDVSKMLEAMEQTTSFYYPEDILYDIIYEEITAFLSGQKSAEETAHVVQSRVSLYLEERR